jgi:hypothetical protein
MIYLTYFVYDMCLIRLYILLLIVFSMYVAQLFNERESELNFISNYTASAILSSNLSH